MKRKHLFMIVLVLSVGMMLCACDGGCGSTVEQGEIEAQYAVPGAYATTTDNIPGFVLHYPQDMTGGHPIITWGNGTGASPNGYAELLSHLASWGFVVIASESSNTGSGQEMLEGVDYLIEQNSTPGSIFYAKLDTGKIGATGHSQGGMGTTRAALDPRITCSAPLAGAFSTSQVAGPMLLIAGAEDTIVPASSVERGFNSATAPTMFAIAQDMGHMDFAYSGNSCRGYLTAWFMYLLQDDATAARAFVGDCEICDNSNWVVETKNFADMPVPGQSTPDPTPTPGPGPDPINGSDGCGNRNYPQATRFTMNVDGTQREYIVTLPDNYDPDHPYRLIFTWHYMGGSAERIVSGGHYGLERLADDTAIFVSGQGLSSSGTTGWPNTGGRDVAFARAMYEAVADTYCVDTQRVFSTGMSYGGIMSNTVGCAMGDVMRAIAPIAGMGPSMFTFGTQCAGQVAAWIAHGNNDGIIPFRSGQASRDHWLETNGCSDQSYPTSPDSCVAYEGCDVGYPVHWCEFNGGHTVPSFAPEAIWDFFVQF